MSTPDSQGKQGGSGTRLPDVELLAVLAGIKPSVRTTIDAERVESLERRWKQLGLVVKRAHRDALLPGRAAQSVVYGALDEAKAEEVRAAEEPVLPGGPPRPADDTMFNQHRRLGRALGYPDCCVEAFVARLKRGVTRRAAGGDASEDFVAAEDAFLASTTFHGRLNNLLFDRQLRLVSFFPCRFDCPAGLDFAARVFAEVQRREPAAAPVLAQGLVGTLVIAPDGRRGPELVADGAITLRFDTF